MYKHVEEDQITHNAGGGVLQNKIFSRNPVFKLFSLKFSENAHDNFMEVVSPSKNKNTNTNYLMLFHDFNLSKFSVFSV